MFREGKFQIKNDLKIANKYRENKTRKSADKKFMVRQFIVFDC